jgi:hypothetical protein
MKQINVLIFVLLVSVSDAEAQDSTRRSLTLDIALSDHTNISVPLYNFGVAIESNAWRFGVALGYSETFFVPTDFPTIDHREWSVFGMYKVSVSTFMFNAGISIGMFDYSSTGVFLAPSVFRSGAYLGLISEIGLGDDNFFGGLHYQRRISNYTPTNVIGAWLRYRIPV